jgi:hypothetical protein
MTARARQRIRRRRAKEGIVLRRLLGGDARNVNTRSVELAVDALARAVVEVEHAVDALTRTDAWWHWLAEQRAILSRRVPRTGTDAGQTLGVASLRLHGPTEPR